MAETFELFRVVTAAVIHDGKGNFLLAQRAAKDGNLPGFWSLPAGHVEVSDNVKDVLEDNLIREVKEELGVEIEIKAYLDSHSWVAEEYKKVTVVYICRIASGEPKPLSETKDVKWFTESQIPNLALPPNVMRVLYKAMQKLKSNI